MSEGAQKFEEFISVVIAVQAAPSPLFRDEINQLSDFLKGSFDDYEIVIVDNTRLPVVAHQCEDILENVQSVRSLSMAFQVAEDVTWAAGLENAIGDIVILFTPGEDPVEVVLDLAKLARDGNDVIVGIAKERTSPGYAVVRPLTSWLLAAIDYKLPKNATSLWCVTRRVVNAVTETGRFHNQLYMRFYRTGYQVKTHLYKKLPSTARRKTIREAFAKTIRQMVFNSTRPLRWASLMGLIGSFAAFLFGIYSVAIRLIRQDVMEGWTSLVFIMSFLFMIMFFILYFFGAYLGRLLDDRSEHRDYFIAQERSSQIMLDAERYNVKSK